MIPMYYALSTEPFALSPQCDARSIMPPALCRGDSTLSIEHVVLRAFSIDNKIYKSSLEYLLCCKADYLGITDFNEQMKKCESMDQLKVLGDKIGSTSEWVDKELEVLKKAHIAKFSQHKDLLHVLLQVSDKELVKTGKDDIYWGIGLETMNLNSQKKEHWLGENRLGKHLMDVKSIIESKKD